jgi:transcriptional regulator with XRE-family HTH domain
MNGWGLKIGELLAAKGKRASWLAKEAGVSRSTVTNWLNNPEGVQPTPLNVAKVAKALGMKTRDLAPYAGYPIVASADDTERSIRRANPDPRAVKMMNGVERLKPRDQDTVYSMVEAFIASRQEPQ